MPQFSESGLFCGACTRQVKAKGYLYVTVYDNGQTGLSLSGGAIKDVSVGEWKKSFDDALEKIIAAKEVKLEGARDVPN